MIDAAPSIDQARLDVVRFKIRHFIKDLSCVKTGRKKVQDIAYADSHASYAGTTTTFSWIDRDTFE